MSILQLFYICSSSSLLSSSFSFSSWSSSFSSSSSMTPSSFSIFLPLPFLFLLELILLYQLIFDSVTFLKFFWHFCDIFDIFDFWLCGVLMAYLRGWRRVYSCNWSTFLFYDSFNSGFWISIILGLFLTFWGPRGLILGFGKG